MNAFLRHPLGWLLRSARYYAGREVVTWHRSNALHKELRYNWLHLALIRMGEHHVRYCFEVPSLVGLILWNLYLWKVPGPGMGFENIVELEARLVHFTAFWTVQATLVILPYAVVFALGAIVFNDRDSSQEQLDVYLADSCMTLTGLSALTLTFVLLAQFSFIGQDLKLEDESLKHLKQWLLLLDFIWFGWNIVLAGYFLSRSVAFLRPVKRRKILLKYVLSITWPRQFEHRMATYLLDTANYQEGILDFAKDDAALGSAWDSMGDTVCCTVTFETPRYVHDANFRIMQFVVSRWVRRRNAVPNPVTGNSRNRAVLLFPMSFDLIVQGKRPLAKLMHPGPGLTWWEQRLVRATYRFTRDDPFELPTVDRLIDELRDETLIAIEARRYQAFVHRHENLVELITKVLQSSEYIGDDGQHGNAAFTVVTRTFGQHTYKNWFRAHREVIKACVAALDADSEYFDYSCRIAGHFVVRLRELFDVTMARESIDMSSYVFYELSKWWVRAVEDQGIDEHSAGQRVVLLPPKRATYISALNEFVGAYENLRRWYFFDPAKSSLDDWKQVQANVDLHAAHLDRLVQMLFDVVDNGDELGSVAVMDMLQKWCADIDLRLGGDMDISERAWTFNVNDVLKNTAKQADDLMGASEYWEFGENRVATYVGTTIRNYWADCFCVAIYGLLQRVRDHGWQGTLPASLLRAAIAGKSLRGEGETAVPRRAAESRDDLLKAIIRQEIPSRDPDGAYAGRIGGVFRRTQGVEADRISGRIHSGSVVDVGRQYDGELLYLMIAGEGEWHPESELRGYLTTLVNTNNEAARALRDQFRMQSAHLEGGNFNIYKIAYLAALGLEDDTANSERFEAAVKEVQEGLYGLHTFITQQLDTSLGEAEIDPERIRDVEFWASKSAFNKELSGIPLALFKSVKFSPNVEATEAIRFANLAKGEFVKPLQTSLAASEGRYANSMNRVVAGTIMKDILERLICPEVDAATPERYWEEFKKSIAKIQNAGQKPMLLIESRQTPKWVWDWAMGRPREGTYIPPDLQVTREVSLRHELGYFATFNGVRVAYLPLYKGMSVVLPSAVFDKITFKTYRPGIYVEAKEEIKADQQTTIDVVVKWGHEISFDSELVDLCSKLIYSKQD